MDPNLVLRKAREALARGENDEYRDSYLDEVAEAFAALDGWLSNGGGLCRKTGQRVGMIIIKGMRLSEKFYLTTNRCWL